MENYYLPATTYSPSAPNASRLASPLDRRATINTIIEESPQIPHLYQDYFAQNLTQQWAQYTGRDSFILPSYQSPTYSEDFPTPKASLHNPQPVQQQPEKNWPLSPRSPDRVSSPQWSESRDDSEFDELYDMTDDDTEEVPLKCSNSVKKSSTNTSARSSRNRYPSLVIPSPSHWPTIEKLQKSAVSPAPVPALTPAQNVLNMLAARKLNDPATSAEPSLDGSLSSEELEHLSCPSTPDQQGQKEGDWSGPVQLNPAAMETLHHISRDDAYEDGDQVLQVAEGEMTQVGDADRLTMPVQRIFTNDLTRTPSDVMADEDDFSALTIPSPGGFFSSLQGSARHTWSIPPQQKRDETPSTSVAENFYGVPWRERPENIVEHVVEVPDNFGAAEPTPNALDGFLSPVGEIMEIQPSATKFEYNEHYAQELAQLASKNLSRTSLWITAQDTWLEGMLSPISPISHERGNSVEDIGSPSKKSVRFVDLVVPKTPPMPTETVLSKDTTFLEALEFLRETTGKFDSFIHRLTRAEAVHLQRRCAPKRHNNLLLGRYELCGYSKIPSSRPVSLFYTDDPNEHKEQIAKAQKEQQVLELVRPAFWALQASRVLHGGRLITSPAYKILSHSRDDGATRVLDLGGQAVCDWAWQVALDFPLTSVFTVSTKNEEPVKVDGEEGAERDIEGPANHQHKVVHNYWTLPFPNGHFDVVSARNLHEILKTSRPGPSSSSSSTYFSLDDEYDLCLKECMRILKPGGYLEFALLDADVLHAAAGSHAQKASVEFAFNLRTRGYDAQPTKSFLPRLARAGFNSTKDVRRAWQAVPFPRPGAKWSETLNVGADESVAREKHGVDVLTSPRTSLELQRVQSPQAQPAEKEKEKVVKEKTIGPNGEVEPFSPSSFFSSFSRHGGRHGHKRADSLMDNIVNTFTSSAHNTVSPPTAPAPAPALAPAPTTPLPPPPPPKDSDNKRGSTKDVRDLVGLVGARAWEKWLVKLQAEMRGGVEGLGDGVTQALEEGARDGCAWRCLEGWARKGF